MKQYLDLLKTIKEEGAIKLPARPGMPSTQSYFGYQFRHDLSKGFPLLTTKKLPFRWIVVELLWFLKGDTNVHWLNQQGVNIWNEDAYNYYVKVASKNSDASWNPVYMGIVGGKRVKAIVGEVDAYSMYTFEEFEYIMKTTSKSNLQKYYSANGYTLGDCGYQYGRTWRNGFGKVDQIQSQLNRLKVSPESRRHVVSSIDPAHDEDLALYWCHALFQFNCRPLVDEDRIALYHNQNPEVLLGSWLYPEDCEWNEETQSPTKEPIGWVLSEEEKKFLDEKKIPRYYLDCQMYQRSMDVMLGAPFNIASYSLLTHIFAKCCNMVPGVFVHSIGDAHIYDNLQHVADSQLTRVPYDLPTLWLNPELNWESMSIDDVANLDPEKDFKVLNYQAHPHIKGILSTGRK